MNQSEVQMKAFSILLFLVLGALPFCSAEGSTEKEGNNSEWWITPKNSPLAFGLSRGGRYLDLVNVSQYVVTSHTLGCVAEVNGGLRLEKKLRPRKQELKPGEGLFELKQSYRQRYYSKCNNRFSKLAVVKVQYAGGKEWVLHRPTSQKKQQDRPATR
jgi:hypothetical protein